ncbi:MAG: glutamate ligase domain-containing protein [Beutenbergiaceae bacterium]
MTSQHAIDSHPTFAVCGSAGKATTCYLIEHIVAALGRSTAIYSTVETKVGTHSTPVERGQQPDVAQLREQARTQHIDDTILELPWTQLGGGHDADIDVMAFTGLDAEYEADLLDQHRQQALQALTAAKHAVILVDSPEAVALAEQVPAAVTVGTGRHGADADWQASIHHTSLDHMDFTITHRGGQGVSMSLWLPARFSIGLAALALIAVLQTGVTSARLAQALPRGLRPVVPGRMERVAAHPRCIVDISHTPARLRRALTGLRSSTKRQLLVVVAARASDSVQTRQELGAAAAIADTVVITDDDYGADVDSAALRGDIRAGAAAAGAANIAEVSPRQAAIRSTVALADRHDTVLIAGRGHLTQLEIAGTDDYVDDRAEVRAGLAQREGSAELE